jgi:glycosyltransferase involved in cell wall biosynthesis
MLFSVIIPTYNRLQFLSQTLASVWQQTYTDYELIVVDDGSNDDTAEYLQSVGNRLKVFCQSNKGPGAARNLGASQARGEYIAFLDSDDLWFPWTLEVYREIIRSENCPSFIAGKPYRFWNENELEKVVQGALRTEWFPDYLASGEEWRWWGVSSFVLRREAFMVVGGFTNERVNGEDADLALRLGMALGFVQVTNPATFAYREHEASAVKDLQRTLAGAWLKVRSEWSSGYPGGATRATERRRILTRHTRPVTLSCLQQGLRREAWALYKATFAWNTALGRVRYLAGFPLLAVMSRLRASEGPALLPVPRGE